jgi:hypothetical protein
MSASEISHKKDYPPARKNEGDYENKSSEAHFESGDLEKSDA